MQSVQQQPEKSIADLDECMRARKDEYDFHKTPSRRHEHRSDKKISEEYDRFSVDALKEISVLSQDLIEK